MSYNSHLICLYLFVRYIIKYVFYFCSCVICHIRSNELVDLVRNCKGRIGICDSLKALIFYLIDKCFFSCAHDLLCICAISYPNRRLSRIGIVWRDICMVKIQILPFFGLENNKIKNKFIFQLNGCKPTELHDYLHAIEIGYGKPRVGACVFPKTMHSFKFWGAAGDRGTFEVHLCCGFVPPPQHPSLMQP